jgi:predicted ATPase
MVGRDAELSAIRNVMADLKQGLGRIIFVLGEAGLGKTRLISEAHDVFQTLGHTRAVWVETISLSYETNQAYGLFQRLMRRIGGIEYNDAPAVLREKLRGAACTRSARLRSVVRAAEREQRDSHG